MFLDFFFLTITTSRKGSLGISGIYPTKNFENILQNDNDFYIVDPKIFVSPSLYSYIKFKNWSRYVINIKVFGPGWCGSVS